MMLPGLVLGVEGRYGANNCVATGAGAATGTVTGTGVGDDADGGCLSFREKHHMNVFVSMDMI